MKLVKMVAGIALCAGLALGLAAQTEDAPPAVPVMPPAPAPAFGMSMIIGYVPLYSQASGQMESWQHLGFSPELTIGEFGIGLNLDFNFRFNSGASGDSFEIRQEDWVVNDFAGFLATYLPKIRYVRYGTKGAPLYLTFGDINNGRLGNGLIVNGFDNTLHQPGQRVFGMSFDIDGRLFDFPWIGLETMVGNFAAWDVLAMRLYSRPAAKSGVPLMEGLQVGVTLAIDTNPYYFSPVASVKANTAASYAGLWGLDFLTPILANDFLSLNLLGDFALQNTRFGTQVGAGGSIIKVFSYQAMLRIGSPAFIFGYFDKLYDLQRETRLAAFQGTGGGDPVAGWFASLGAHFFDGALYATAAMDGAFVIDTAQPSGYPDLQASVGLKPGLLAGLSLEGHYYKADIRSWENLVDGRNALIGARLDYALGPAVIGIVCDVTYDPYAAAKGMATDWTVSSRIETSLVLLTPGVTK
jgi:hypothetical protein